MRYVILHNIRSLHNIGSIFRTADGAGVDKIYLTGLTACPPRKEIAKVALGAENSVKWEYHPDPVKLIQKLKKQKIQILALEKAPQSKAITTFKAKRPFCLIVGNEVEGVYGELLHQADEVLKIPMHGKKESLNVSVAFGVAIYSLGIFEKR